MIANEYISHTGFSANMNRITILAVDKTVYCGYMDQQPPPHTNVTIDIIKAQSYKSINVDVSKYERVSLFSPIYAANDPECVLSFLNGRLDKFPSLDVRIFKVDIFVIVMIPSVNTYHIHVI